MSVTSGRGNPRGRVSGQITRGTTHPNRLRRFDRWIIHRCAGFLRAPGDRMHGWYPLVADLGYGSSPATTVELADRLTKAFGRVAVVGVEIDPARVERARDWLGAQRRTQERTDPQGPVVDFVRGGFELPVGGRPQVVRACNVLRQYPLEQVRPAWEQLARGLAAGGVLIEGTCDELGRLAAWVTIVADSGLPRVESLTVSADLTHLGRPADLAARLPKALIHDNHPGRPVHDFLRCLDRNWERAAPAGTFGPRQRWRATAAAMHSDGWPVALDERRWRLGELTVAWDAVATPGW